MNDDWPTAAEWLASGSADPRALLVAGMPLAATAVTPSRYDLAPSAVRERLKKLSTFDAEHGSDLRLVPVADVGDALEAPPLDADLTVLLGGHNGVTFEALRQRSDLHRWGLLTLDAHHDVRPYDGTPGNGSPVRALLDAGLPGRHVVQIGIHGFSNSPEHRRWCEAQGIRMLGLHQLATLTSMLDALATSCDHLYVDIDIDVLDRAHAPACPGARPGGLLPRSLFEAAYEIGRHPHVRAVDLVEVDPEQDVASITVDAMAITLLFVASGYGERLLSVG